MKLRDGLLTIVFAVLAMFAAGCGGETEPVTPSGSAVEGPAVVLFFTDP